MNILKSPGWGFFVKWSSCFLAGASLNLSFPTVKRDSLYLPPLVALNIPVLSWITRQFSRILEIKLYFFNPKLLWVWSLSYVHEMPSRILTSWHYCDRSISIDYCILNRKYC